MTEGQVQSCHSFPEWTDFLDKHKSPNKLIVIDFTATWCGPCRMIAPILADYAKRFPHVAFVKVDVDEMKEVAEQFGVEAMPTFLFMKGGEQLEKVVGANKDQLLEVIVKHAGVPAVATA